jgi:hypothetical protein
LAVIIERLSVIIPELTKADNPQQVANMEFA